MPLSRVFLRFVVVNVVNTGLYYLLYLLLLLAMPYVAANVVALVVAIGLAYLMNARWAFQVDVTGRSLLGFLAGNVTTTVVRTLVLWLLVEFAGLGERGAPILATAVTLPVGYVLAKLAMGNGDVRPPVARVAATVH